jgi:hypothetical protein
MMFTELLSDVDQLSDFSFFATSFFEFFVVFGFGFVVILDVDELSFILVEIVKVLLDLSGL